MSGSTIRSLSFPTVLIPPTLPSQYLSYLIVTTLQRAGFDGAEAGALAEMERLLEHRECEERTVVAYPRMWPETIRRDSFEVAGHSRRKTTWMWIRVWVWLGMCWRCGSGTLRRTMENLLVQPR
jgi:hypothetical protein